MIASMFLGLGLMIQPASADLQLIRYDSYPDDGEDWGGVVYFGEPPGFGQYNCMAMVYSFNEDQYPLEIKGLNVFWVGEGAGVTQEAMMRMYIDWYEGEADQYIMQNGRLYERLENKKILVSGIDMEGTWQELDFETENIRVDFDPDVPGIQPITYGSVVVSLCYENQQALPVIAFDTNGYEEEPPPVDGDDYLDGHETSSFRSMILWNSVWSTLEQYVGGGDVVPGDFIMRLVIDANVETSTDPSGCQDSDDWNVTTIKPDRMTKGDSVNVLIGGEWNFPQDASVRVGDTDLQIKNINSSCGIEGRVDSSLKAGTYKVQVAGGDGQWKGDLTFTVEGSKGGCASADVQPMKLLWFLPLVGLAFRRRR